MISHRASLTFVNWAYDYFQVQSTDRVSNHAPFHFDLSVFDLFTGIQAGATVVLVPPGLSVFPQSLASFIAKQRITIWSSPITVDPINITREFISASFCVTKSHSLRR
jgi:non-ribosomal peptide synthetase component F